MLTTSLCGAIPLELTLFLAIFLLGLLFFTQPLQLIHATLYALALPRIYFALTTLRQITHNPNPLKPYLNLNHLFDAALTILILCSASIMLDLLSSLGALYVC